MHNSASHLAPQPASHTAPTPAPRPTTTHPTSGDQPPAPATLDERLDKIEQSIDKLSERLPKPKTKKIIKEEDKKTALALAFGSVGMFGLGAIGAKIGAITDGLSLVWRYITKPGDLKHGSQFLKEATIFELYKTTVIGSAFGALIGLFAGAAIGVLRGERLDDPSDLFKEPIESFKKIFGKEPVKAPEAGGATPVDDKAASEKIVQGATHEGMVVAAPSRAVSQ